MRYAIFDNNRLAQYPDVINVDPSWDNAIYNTFDEALNYALRWLNLPNAPLKLNTPYDYSGFGDIIEIREVKDAD